MRAADKYACPGGSRSGRVRRGMRGVNRVMCGPTFGWEVEGRGLKEEVWIIGVFGKMERFVKVTTIGLGCDLKALLEN